MHIWYLVNSYVQESCCFFPVDVHEACVTPGLRFCSPLPIFYQQRIYVQWYHGGNVEVPTSSLCGSNGSKFNGFGAVDVHIYIYTNLYAIL